MQFEGALIKEQGVEFAVVIVKPHVLRDRSTALRMIGTCEAFFGTTVVLMAQDSRGRPTYYGRPDIARFMAEVPLSLVPWKRYSVS